MKKSAYLITFLIGRLQVKYLVNYTLLTKIISHLTARVISNLIDLDKQFLRPDCKGPRLGPEIKFHFLKSGTTVYWGCQPPLSVLYRSEILKYLKFEQIFLPIFIKFWTGYTCQKYTLSKIL